jgi:hypothetical protein
LLFVVPFFHDGDITQMRIYSNVMTAQRALRRYVGHSELLKAVRKHSPGISARQAMLDTYGAIARTRFAGTGVWEIRVDDRLPVTQPGSQPRRRASRRT